MLNHYIELCAKGRRLLYGVKNNVLPDWELEREKQIRIGFDLGGSGRIAGLLSDAVKSDNSTVRSYFLGVDDEKRQSVDGMSDQTAFFAIYKDQMVTNNVRKQDYLDLVDLSWNLK